MTPPDPSTSPTSAGSANSSGSEPIADAAAASGAAPASGAVPASPTGAQPWEAPAVAFVLFADATPAPEEVTALLTEVFAGGAPVEPAGTMGCAVRLGDTSVLAQPISAPIPDGEASRCARDLAIWNGRQEVVDRHLAHVVVTAVPELGDGPGDQATAGADLADAHEPDPTDLDPTDLDPTDPDPVAAARTAALRRELAVANVAAAVTALDGAVAVYVGGAASTLPAEEYRSMVAGHPIPVPALVGVRAGWQDEGTSCVYTTGLDRFGRMEMERRDVPGHPGGAYGQMCDLIAFALGTGTVFADGQTLEVGEGRTLGVVADRSPLTGWDVLRLHPDGD